VIPPKNFPQARHHIERQRDIAGPAGLAYSQVLSSLNLGVLDLDAGNLHAARPTLERTIRLGDSLGYNVQRVSRKIRAVELTAHPALIHPTWPAAPAG